MTLPTVGDLLGVAGREVRLEETGPGAPSALIRYLEQVAPWLSVRATVSETTPTIALRGFTPHGRMRFVGSIENRMVEPLVLTLRALATQHTDLDTPATPALLAELQRDVPLRVIVGVHCPFCPAAAAIALRLACVSTRVHVTILRAEAPEAPQVKSVPLLLDGEHILAQGPLQEISLVQALLRAR